MANTNSIQKTPSSPTPAKSLKDFLLAPDNQKAIASALPQHITPERMLRISMTAFDKNPKLLECTQVSVFRAIRDAAQSGLVPDGIFGEGFFIPYWNNKKKVYECQFQRGYKGVIKHCINYGSLVSVTAVTVKENDEFYYERGLNPVLIHKPPINKPRGRVVAYYAVAELKNGKKEFEPMSMSDVLEYAVKNSPSLRGKSLKKGVEEMTSLTDLDCRHDGGWFENFDDMAKKSCIIQVLKYVPKSSEIERDIERLQNPYQGPDDEVTFDDEQVSVFTEESVSRETGVGDLQKKIESRKEPTQATISESNADDLRTAVSEFFAPAGGEVNIKQLRQSVAQAIDPERANEINGVSDLFDEELSQLYNWITA